MNKGQLDYAIRKAHESFDKWNDCTGLIPKFSGYYFEALAEIETAVKIGAIVACGKDVVFDENDELVEVKP